MKNLFKKVELKGQKVLEICCGNGFRTQQFSRIKGIQISAIDPDTKSISFAKNNNFEENIDYTVGQAEKLDFKEKTFDILISSSPITLSVTSFKEVNSGQEFELAVTMNSNSKDVIKNLLLKANYPFGFNFVSSDIKPISDTTVWKIGDIPPGGKKIVKIIPKRFRRTFM